MLHKKTTGIRVLCVLLSLVLVLLAGCGKEKESTLSDQMAQGMDQEQTPQTPEEPAPEEPTQEDSELPKLVIQPRPQLLDLSAAAPTEIAAQVAAYGAEPDLSNVVNLGQFYLSEEETHQLAQNLFTVTRPYGNEFFEVYEDNRYFQQPSFVTVDSMMHTYHLYFSLLLNRTEKNYLAADLLALSEAMLESSAAQYAALRGTAWEEAALRNVTFFAVAARLQGSEAAVPQEALETAEVELGRIMAAAGIDISPLALDYVDYTQYIPRGCYAGDPVLESYFRAMIWYGQINFTQKEDSLNRSALLMTLAMEDGALEDWQRLYLVTSFFAGASDDLSYYEYAPAIEAAYGRMPAAEELADNEEAYGNFVQLVDQLEPPAINSVPVEDKTEDIAELKKGFRFMGQRFTIDAAIMQKLVYSSVEPAADKSQRMLPDVLDLPAALGSQAAMDLLVQQGVLDFPNFSEKMQEVQAMAAAAPASTWSSSLYSSWLYTLEPLLQPKGNGYPSFMNSTEWLKKDLETYAGSYTELKHDTVLYAKQIMAEMGGGPMEKIDDRGYVEPETEVYRRFAALAEQTARGLDGFGYLGEADLENLSRLAELAQKLLVISEKELRNELPTEEEFELIRSYGGTLEHFWVEAVKDKAESDFLAAQEIPSSLVTDIATDPNGTVLQVANGQPARILVIVPVDGTLRLAVGSVFDFYQFEQPMDQRLTDQAWRQMIGQWMKDDGTYNWQSEVPKPWWTTSYRAK